MKTLPTAKRVARWMVYVGLVCGVLYSFGGLVVDALTIGLNWGTAMAFLAIVGMPVMFGAFGFLLGALVAVVAGGVGKVLERKNEAGRVVSMQNESERLARAWIDGWNAGKPDDIPLASDFTHASPFGVIKGRDEYLAKVKPMAAKNVASLEIVRVLGGDGESAIWYEVTTPNGVLQACDWVQTDNDVIVAITSFYDATDLPYRERYGKEGA